MKTEQKSKYNYTESMCEISGFGGGYEMTCRNMVIAGLEWLDSHPEAKISYGEYKNVYGLTTNESPDCKILQDEMLKASGNDCTGAMMQACLGHVMYAYKNGWGKYVEKMTEKPKS
jgi:hypothetical protein